LTQWVTFSSGNVLCVDENSAHHLIAHDRRAAGGKEARMTMPGARLHPPHAHTSLEALPGARDERLVTLIGDAIAVPCLDGEERPYLNLDNAASTNAMPAVARRVAEFLPWYSSVHRGAGFKSRQATDAYERARAGTLAFAGRADGDGDVAIICRNTTEAINHLAYRLRLAPDDVVVTTVVEHHANLLPWARLCQRRFVETGADGTFTADDVARVLDNGTRPRLLAMTGASNVTGWLPPLKSIIDLAHERGIPVLIDAAQLAPHRPLPAEADFLAWSGHKMYAPFGAGVLIGPRATFADGDPFLAGGGAVDLVDLDEVIWADPPEREEAGSPNVVGAVALDAAISELARMGWERITAHDDRLTLRLHSGLASLPGVRVLGPEAGVGRLPVVAFVIEGMHHALVAARLSAEFGIGVRHGCFCAHPYLIRLIGLSPAAVAAYRRDVQRHDRRDTPGAVRASAGLSTTTDEVDRLVAAVSELASGRSAPVAYLQDGRTGDFWPETDVAGWSAQERGAGGHCARG
jgi:selenocysteine lyase/cysteine desulfurase